MQFHTKKTQYLAYNGPIGNGDKNNHLKLKIGISGASEIGICGRDSFEQAKVLGREVILQGGIVVTGATYGFPAWAASGAKEENGISIGVSPASNEREHTQTYRLPIENIDVMMYTGFGYPGADFLMTRSCDAIIVGCGRIGTLHEFMIAFEEGKPVGVLEGEWDIPDAVRNLIHSSDASKNQIIFEKDPKILVEKIISLTTRQKSRFKE